MANDSPDSSDERRMTADRERIREWAEAHDAVPVSVREGEGGPSLARRDELDAGHEEHTWDEFFETFEEGDWVFVYHEEEPTGEGIGFFEFVERDRAFDRADLGRDEFEDALRRGETVTTEIVETRVVEREIVERDTIESEIVEADVAERELVDTEILDREVVELEFVDEDAIEVVVDETRLETFEEIEHVTVESRVVDVDVDVEQREDLERDEMTTEVGIDSVQRSILESDVIHSDVVPDEALEDEMIRSSRTEGDVVQSELVERRTIEEQVQERRRMRYTLETADVIDTEVVTSEIIEGELVDVEEYASIGESTATGVTAAEPGGAEATEPGTVAESDAGMEAPTGDVPEGAESPAIQVSGDERGKDVVDATGQEVGIVTAVEGETIYVDPEPGLTDRLRARLNWGGHDEDEYPVEAAQIAEITDDEVVLRGE